MFQSGHKMVPLLRSFRKYPVSAGAINISSLRDSRKAHVCNNNERELARRFSSLFLLRLILRVAGAEKTIRGA